MRIENIHFHFHSSSDGEVLRLLEEIKAGLKAQGAEIMASLDDLSQGVADESTLEDSLVTMFQNYQQQITAAAGDQAKIDQINQLITANKAKLAAALASNTPAAPVTDGATPAAA